MSTKKHYNDSERTSALLTVSELAAMEAKELNDHREMYFRDLNEERVKCFIKFFDSLRESAHVAIHQEQRINKTIVEPLLRDYVDSVAVIEYAQTLFDQQLTAFLTETLPKWLAAQVKAKFPDELGEAFAIRVRDIDALQGMIWEQAREEHPLFEIVVMAATQKRARAGAVVQFNDDEVKVIKRAKARRRRLSLQRKTARS